MVSPSARLERLYSDQNNFHSHDVSGSDPFAVALVIDHMCVVMVIVNWTEGPGEFEQSHFSGGSLTRGSRDN